MPTYCVMRFNLSPGTRFSNTEQGFCRFRPGTTLKLGLDTLLSAGLRSEHRSPIVNCVTLLEEVRRSALCRRAAPMEEISQSQKLLAEVLGTGLLVFIGV